jgi:hypothetical protein
VARVNSTNLPQRAIRNDVITANSAGETAGLVFGALLLVVRGYYLVKGGEKRQRVMRS